MSELGLLGLSFLAGGLSTLAPCVLPVLPFVIFSATQEHCLGPLALASGLVGAFTLFGITSSILIGQFDLESVRKFASIILVATGIVFLFPKLKHFIAPLLQPISNHMSKSTEGFKAKGLIGQFILGTIFGLLWAPCTGPTLGIAIGLAAQQGDLARATLMFLLFGIGAASSLLIFGRVVSLFGRTTLRKKLSKGVLAGNSILGFVSVSIGILVLTGAEGAIEETVLRLMPKFLLSFTSKF